MSPRGVIEFYYTRSLPARSVAIAQVSTTPLTPSQLTDIANTTYLPGTLGIWLASGTLANNADFVAPDLNQSVAISGSTLYALDNQFFELTNIVSGDNIPLYYFHVLPANVTNVTILDLNDNVVDADILIQGNLLYHSMDGGAYRVRYADSGNVVHSDLLLYNKTQLPNIYAPSATGYVLVNRVLQVAGNGTYHIRFTAPNGYLVTAPYGTPPNTPWYPRVRFPAMKPAPEWARQVFLPMRPYALAAWVPGTVLSSSVVEFERKQIFYDAAHLPDIIVFDKDNNFKFALEGSLPGSPRRRGSIYNWKRGLIKSVDTTNARVDVAVELATDDLVFGFYSYLEPDVIYRAIDINPFTNPSVRNTTIRFYYRTDSDPFRVIYHQVFDSSGPVSGQTNDPSPPNWTSLPNSIHVFSNLVVGASVGPGQFTITDVRQRGGGLAPESQGIPEAVNFWDLGYLDGKPYPIGGALVLYLPSSILETLSKADIESRVQASVPLGSMPVIRYYDPNGEESV